MYSEHVGNIFDTTADAIGHGVNCRGVMGAGIAKVVKSKMSDQFYTEYRTLCLLYGEAMAGDYNESYDDDSKLHIVNLFTQVDPGANAKYNLLVSAMTHLVKGVGFDHGVESIALPRIGCGIGGLEWATVKPILQGFSRHIDIEVWELEGVKW